MKKFITLAGTLLLSLPLLAQTSLGSGTNPNSGTGTSFGTPIPNNEVNLDSGKSTAVKKQKTNTSVGTGAGFSPVAPTSQGKTPETTNPMGNWQGK